MIRGVLVGVILTVIVLFGGAYLYFSTGRAPVATDAPEMPFEHKMAHIALDAYMDKMPHVNSPVPADENNFLEGATTYKEHCAVCHGLPDLPRTAIANGMFPKPPQLFHGTGVTDDEAWQTYWTISGGIRMTGMPGFKAHLSETQMWQVAVLLKNADKIPATVKARLLAANSPTLPIPAAPMSGSAAEPPHDHSTH
jgi:thiosulfate dehydrogenase